MKKLAIVGTAETWRDAPYDDLSWKIYSLNDAYRLGLKRADMWADIHDPDEWWLVEEGKKAVNAWERPKGKFYPRPASHPEFFAKAKIPCYVKQARPEWPTSITFPREAIEKRFGHYMASTPAWMLAQAMLPEEEGGFGFVAGDLIGIWGVHLATEREYVEQRPNFEWIIGRAEERGIAIALPVDCPIRKTDWVYGFEHRPDFGTEPVKWEMQHAELERQKVLKWLLGPQTDPLKTAPVPLWVGDDPKLRLAYFEAMVMEASGRLQACRLREKGLAA